jgi:hypothetical protein
LPRPVRRTRITEDAPPAASGTPDNQTTTVPATTSVLVNVTSGGRTGQQTVHLAKVGNRFSWFTDCTP